jgi:intein/homing endonuclease
MHVTDFEWLDERFTNSKTPWRNANGEWINRVGYYMDEYLAKNMMGVPAYLKKAWDVVGIVSGHGKVRIGKCEHKGSKVLMSNGTWKNIEDIKKGDLVISPDVQTGKYSIAKVIETHSRFCNDMYNVCNKSTEEVLYACADNHDIPIEYVETKRVPGYRGKGEKRQFKFKRHYTKMEAKELALKSFSWLRNRGVVTFQGFFIDKFEGVDNATIEPYSLGVFLGDGSVCSNKKKGRRLSITCSSPEVMAEVSKHYSILNIKPGRGCKDYTFSINSNFYLEIIKYKLGEKISGTKFIPEECKKSDAEYRLKILAGLIDTDGYINKKGIVTYTTKSLQLAKDIQEICRSLGGNTNIKKITKQIKKRNFEGTYYNVQINLGKNQTKIPIKRPLKITRLKNQKQSKNKVGIIVKKTKPGMVYGFELDSESHLYITDNYSVTHNSTLALQIAYFLAWMLAGGKMGQDEKGEKWIVEKRPDKPVRFGMENIVFSPEELMKKASELFKKYGRNQVIVYDEGRAGLDSARAMQAINKVMQDFFQECGQYGHIIIIVLPSFFKLHEDYATSRSLFLVDVYADNNLRRGFFNFYTERQKEYLYLMSRKELGHYQNIMVVITLFQEGSLHFCQFQKKIMTKLKQKL